MVSLLCTVQCTDVSEAFILGAGQPASGGGALPAVVEVPADQVGSTGCIVVEGIVLWKQSWCADPQVSMCHSGKLV